MMYLVTENGVKFVDEDYKPIELDVALVTIRRVAAWVESIGDEPKRDDSATTIAANETAIVVASN